MLENKDSDNTKRLPKLGKKVVKDYLIEKQLEEPMSKKELANVLKASPVEARNKDGESYMNSFCEYNV